MNKMNADLEFLSVARVNEVGRLLTEAGLVPPMIIAVAYWLSIQYLQPSKKQDAACKSNQKRSDKFEPSLLNFCVIVHNAVLCVFSALCFMNTFPIYFDALRTKGVYDGICSLRDAYESTSWGYWSYLFYLSKYYEVMDTYIVILKGRRPINLQIYHHIGAMIGCAWGYNAHTVGTFIFMVPNAFVHSIMYLYYAASTLKIKVPFKSMITYLQMVQFLHGHFWLLYALFRLYPECITVNESCCFVYHLVYITWLFVMFRRFFNKTYNANKKAKKKQT
mmetsp:Transcript_19382/g.30768  ORF Transcript_19382/g.30768 Transcript_19382/m.30768 type:complete len:277 (-) Transcript_19382:492-1322(-)